MAMGYGQNSTHASSLANPVAVAFTPTSADSVLVLMLCVGGPILRTGGTPTFAGLNLTQANVTQIAVSSPETSVEMWYLLNPPAVAATVSIPNAGALTLFTAIATGRATTGQVAVLDSTVGGNNTSTNPSVSITTNYDNCIIFSIVGNGATTWAPSAQSGTVIFNIDDGAFGDGEQYQVQSTAGAGTLSWTFGTSEDWAIVGAAFRESVAGLPNNFQFAKTSSGNTGIISMTEKIR